MVDVTHFLIFIINISCSFHWNANRSWNTIKPKAKINYKNPLLSCDSWFVRSRSLACRHCYQFILVDLDLLSHLFISFDCFNVGVNKIVIECFLPLFHYYYYCIIIIILSHCKLMRSWFLVQQPAKSKLNSLENNWKLENLWKHWNVTTLIYYSLQLYIFVHIHKYIMWHT